MFNLHIRQLFENSVSGCIYLIHICLYNQDLVESWHLLDTWVINEWSKNKVGKLDLDLVFGFTSKTGGLIQTKWEKI